MGNLSAAESCYQASLYLDPDNANALNELDYIQDLQNRQEFGGTAMDAMDSEVVTEEKKNKGGVTYLGSWDDDPEDPNEPTTITLGPLLGSDSAKRSSSTPHPQQTDSRQPTSAELLDPSESAASIQQMPWFKDYIKALETGDDETSSRLLAEHYPGLK